MKKQKSNIMYFTMQDAKLKDAYDYWFNMQPITRAERRKTKRQLKKARKKGYLKNEVLNIDNPVCFSNKKS